MKTTTLAESILVQCDGDLSDARFRQYMRTLAEQEINHGPTLPRSLTIEHAIEILARVSELCAAFESDYEIAKDDPENDVIGYHPTDPAEELIAGSCDAVEPLRRLIEIGLALEESEKAASGR